MLMRRHIYIIFTSVFSILSCINDESVGYQPSEGEDFATVITPVVKHAWTAEMPVTRSLVDNLTTQAMEANFLRLDEDVDADRNGLYSYLGMNQNASDEEMQTYEGNINWEKAKIVEASVISSPDAEGRRSVYLNPVQGYAMRVKTVGEDKITTFYHTRMVSWYPRTCTLAKDSQTGMATDYVFDVYNNSMQGSKYETAVDGNGKKVVKICFTGLNGDTDVMVSNVVEAQYWHKDSDADVICGSDKDDYAGKGRHRDPFGHNDSDPEYENVMTYKHYLSAIRVNAYPENESAQVISLWGEIKNVQVMSQPTGCKIALPSEIDQASGKSTVWGDAEFSEEKHNFDLVRTSMFGDDPNNDDHYMADEVSDLEGYTYADPMKLGYALIEPDKGVVLDVHTDAGVYRVTIPAVMEIDGVQTALFEAGKIYDVNLKFETSNTVAAIILNDDGKAYYDLTSGQDYRDNYNNEYFDHKYSNCYVIYPGIGDFDGFCFNATVVGNGDDGILPGFDRTTADIDPVSAGLIWESSYGLIQQIDLVYGYVRFRVPEYKTKTGNAVIGVFDSDGNVLWSWHIWLAGSQPTLVDYDLGSTTISVMDRNLGALFVGQPQSGPQALDSYGLYYQWGRKDPSMGPPEYNYRPMSTATAEYYDGFGDTHVSTEVVNMSRPTILNGVQKPMYIILPTEWPAYYQFDWLYDRVDNLWGNVGSLRKKTIYDPCPEGYWVPSDHLNMVIQNASNRQGGMTVGTYAMVIENGANDIYLPYAGYKGVDRGMSSLNSTWKYVGQKADYMTSHVLTTQHRGRGYVSSSNSWTEVGTEGMKEFSYNGYFTKDGANRRTAASVRCVKADPFGSVQLIVETDAESYICTDKVTGTFDYLVQGGLMYNKELRVQFGFSDNPDSYADITQWYDGTVDLVTKRIEYNIDRSILPSLTKSYYVWVKMVVVLTDLNNTEIIEYTNCKYNPNLMHVSDIAYDYRTGAVDGVYSIQTNFVDANYNLQYAVTYGVNEPGDSNWETVKPVEQGNNMNFSFTPITDSVFPNIWVRLIATVGGEYVYGEPRNISTRPDVTMTADNVVNGGGYVIAFDDWTSFVGSSDGNSVTYSSNDPNIDTNVFVVEDWEKLTSETSYKDPNGSKYYKVGQCYLKHKGTGKYLKDPGTGGSPTLVDKESATIVQISSQWGNDPNDNNAVDILSANGRYLCRGDNGSLYFNNGVVSDRYKWLIYETPAQ